MNVAAKSQHHIHFGCAATKTTKTFEMLEQTYRDSFATLGYTFSMSHYPELRAFELIKRGQIDGLCGVSERNHNKHLKQQILIKHSIASSRIQLWSRKPFTLSPDRNTPSLLDLNLGYHRGGLSDEGFDNIQFKKKTKIKGVGEGFKMMLSGRIDALASFEFYLLEVSRSLSINTDSLHKETLANINFHPVLSADSAIDPVNFTHALSGTIEMEGKIDETSVMPSGEE